MLTKPTTTQVEARLETLPDRLRDALFSVEIVDFLEKIEVEKKLDTKKSEALGNIVAWVLMGFLHSSGVAQAIQEYAGIDAELAKNITQELDAKLFKTYSADLEKIYTPMGATPAKIMDISAPAPTKTPQPTTTPTPAPIPLTSRTPVPAIPKAPQIWQPTKLNISATASPTPPAPAMTATAAPAKPAPFMMHQESSAAPLATGSDFKLNISKDMFKSAPSKPIDIPRPPKAAELEIGKAPLPPKPPGVTSFRTAPTAQSRVVHYTDMRTVVSPGFGPAQPAATSSAPAPAIIKPPVVPAPTITPPTIVPSAPIKAPQITPAPAPMPAANIPVVPAQTPTAPLPPKPPKVVNFGPEEVK